MAKRKMILVVECNKTGEWWAFERLDALIEHFHFYYKTTTILSSSGKEIIRADITSALSKSGETELHTKRDEETFLYARLTCFK